MAGGAPVPGLSPGTCATISVNGWASVPNNGPWVLGAIVDGWNGTIELNEGNNSKAGATVNVH
jgi:subtilase family serine protease